MSFNLAAVVPRRHTYRVSCGTEACDPTPSVHRLQLGLPGYLILFAPLAFVSQRQGHSRNLPSYWRSFRYLRILPLHRKFQFPLLPSRPVVSTALSRLSRKLSPSTHQSAYTPFTPSKSGQRSPPTYHRGCWHVVSRGFLWEYRHSSGIASREASFPLTGVYIPKDLILHAVSLGRAFAHCPNF